MKLREVDNGWGHVTFEGKFKNCKVIIDRCGAKNSRWYFYLIREQDDLRYNSLWDEIDYSSIEECKDAAEEWINQNG